MSLQARINQLEKALTPRNQKAYGAIVYFDPDDDSKYVLSYQIGNKYFKKEVNAKEKDRELKKLNLDEKGLVIYSPFKDPK